MSTFVKKFLSRQKSFSVAQITQFKIEQIMRTSEKWYRELIKRMLTNDRFGRLWRDITPELYKKTLLDYEYKIMRGNWKNKKTTLKFHLFTSRIIQDIRFQAILYWPEDHVTRNFFVKNLDEPKLISHIALFTDADTTTSRKFLVNDLKSNFDKDRSIYFRYVMNEPGTKSEFSKLLGRIATRVHVRDWHDIQKSSYQNGQFVIKKVLADFRRDLQAKEDINKIGQINSISEVSGYTLKRDRKALLFWENNMEQVITEIFPEKYLRFGFTCVYPMNDLETADDFKQIKKAHENIWFLDKNGDLRVGDDAASYLKTRLSES